MKRLWNKYTRTGLIILVGLSFALAAFIINQNMIQNQVKTKPIYVAKENITPYGQITKNSVEVKAVALSSIPEDAISEESSVDFDNLFASEYGIVKGSPLQNAYTSTKENAKLGQVVGLKEGYVDVAVSTTLVQSAGDGIKPGTYVDVYAYIKDDTKEDRQTSTEKSRIIGPKEEPHLKSVLVKQRLNAEGTVPDPAVGNSLIPTVVVLEVKREVAARYVSFENEAKVHLVPTGHAFNKEEIK